nr:bifunctional precorrin-2 dehydrogenase/sirohydrochlorin ferrochelatase [Evansella caseinilytica]
MNTSLVVKLTGRKCVVVGGGQIAERRVETLLRAGACVSVVSPALTSRLQEWKDRLCYYPKTFDEAMLEKGEPFYTTDVGGGFKLEQEIFLLVAATDSRAVNNLVYERFKDSVPLLNVIDRPEQSSFYFPAVLERGLLQMAVTTSGASPVIAKKIRRQLAEQYGKEYEQYLQRMKEVRNEVLTGVSDPQKRKVLFEKLASEMILDYYKRGDTEAAEQLIQEIVTPHVPDNFVTNDKKY